MEPYPAAQRWLRSSSLKRLLLLLMGLLLSEGLRYAQETALISEINPLSSRFGEYPPALSSCSLFFFLLAAQLYGLVVEIAMVALRSYLACGNGR